MARNSGGSGENSDSAIDSRRRKLLGAMAATGTVGLAGCQSNGGGNTGTTNNGNDPTQTAQQDLEFVEGASLKMPISQVPSNIDWSTPPGNYNQLTYDVALAMNVETGDLIEQMVVDWDWSDSEITFKIHEDATYSDGTPVLAKHWLAEWYTGRFMNPKNRMLSDLTPSAVEEGASPITNVTWDGKTGTFHSEGELLAGTNTEAFFRGRFTKDAAKLEWGPNDPMVKAVEEINQQTDQPLSEEGFQVVEDVAAKYNLRGYGDTDQSSEPPTAEDAMNTPVSGPWQLSEVTESALLLTPNEHFRNADLINYDEIELQAHAEPRSKWTAIQSDILDAVPGSGSPPSTNIINQFPDSVQAHVYGGRKTFQCIYIPAQQKFLGRGPVRQAIMYALNKSQLATIRHKTASSWLEEPPGLQAPLNATDYVDSDLAAKFQKYDYNREMAAERLRSEGFTREDGKWYNPDGDRFSVTLSTGNKVVQLENAIVSSLSNFGIDATLETVGGTEWDGRFNDGEFQMTVQPRVYSVAGVDGEMYVKAVEEEARRKRLGLFPNDEVVQWVEDTEALSRSDYDWTKLIGGMTADLAEQWKVNAPPVGEPNADPTEEYPIASYQMRLGDALDDATRREYMQKLMWVWNWKLPLLPIMTSGNIAFVDHENWIAPTNDSEYDIGFPGPIPNMMYQGRIQADPSGNHG